MRVRCAFCGADYEAPVTPAALVLVARCHYCRRDRLEPADEASPPSDRAPGEVVRIRSRPPPDGERRGQPP